MNCVNFVAVDVCSSGYVALNSQSFDLEDGHWEVRFVGSVR